MIRALETDASLPILKLSNVHIAVPFYSCDKKGCIDKIKCLERKCFRIDGDLFVSEIFS
jgi:hypothetical protein